MNGPEGWVLVTRHICLIKDTGHSGTLWGGTMMSWVDEAGAIFGALVAQNPTLVTKAFSEIDFKTMVRPGDLLEFWGRIVSWGRSSVHVELRVTAQSPGKEEKREVLRVTGTFVAVDSEGKKTAIVPKDPTVGLK